MKKNDLYLTIATSTNAIVKEKGSKFLAFAFPILNENDFKTQLNRIKIAHATARHFCYAYKLGLTDEVYRCNDDGEPNNSAGVPIYGQILSKNITNVAVVVVRYFGGTKLGVGGLVSAYKTATKEALETAIVIEKTVQNYFELTFEYEIMPIVMQLIKKENITVVKQHFEVNCFMEISVRLTKSAEIELLFANIDGLKIKKTCCF